MELFQFRAGSQKVDFQGLLQQNYFLFSNLDSKPICSAKHFLNTDPTSHQHLWSHNIWYYRTYYYYYYYYYYCHFLRPLAQGLQAKIL